jgi:hypothetical protein
VKDLRGVGIQVSKLDQTGNDEKSTNSILNFVKKLDEKIRHPPIQKQNGKFVSKRVIS